MSVDSFDFAMLDLKGGGRIESDTEALEIGSIVSLVTDEGKELAPQGRHELQDGRTIVLDESSKVTEIKEADAPTAAEIEAKKEDGMKKDDMNKHYMKKKSSSEMAMEMDPELISAVSEIIKKTSTELSEEDTNSLANELIKAIVSYTDMAEHDEEEKEEKEEKEEMKEMKVKMQELSSIVLEMAKSQEKFSSDLKKVPSAKAISEIEFSSEPEVIDPIALRIKALQNLNN